DEPAPAEPEETPSEEPAKLPKGPSLPLFEVAEADLTMPKVVLTEAHAKTCKVRIGDTFPNLELPNAKGEPQTLANLFGNKLTVVVFWNASKPTALEELADVARIYGPRFEPL